MPDVNGCPEVARSPKIAEKVCAVEGHKLSVFQNGMTNGPNGPQMNTINFCSNCGLSLNEVRGDLEKSIDVEVERRLSKRMAAIAAAAASGAGPALAGAPGIEIVPDLKAKVVVESPS